jgi:hypothetical protein
VLFKNYDYGMVQSSFDSIVGYMDRNSLNHHPVIDISKLGWCKSVSIVIHPMSSEPVLNIS